MKNDEVILGFIIYYCDRVISNLDFIQNDFELFLENEMVQESCSFALIQIGEKVKSLSDELKTNYNNIDWKHIAGLRDVIAHGYEKRDTFELWDIINNQVPELRNSLLLIQNDYKRK